MPHHTGGYGYDLAGGLVLLLMYSANAVLGSRGRTLGPIEIIACIV